MTVHYKDEQVTLHLGDSLEVIPTLPDASVDAVVTDAPYALANLHQDVVLDALTHWLAGDRAYVPSGRAGFMGKSWDGFVPPPAIWDECLRVLKPGGHLLCFAAPRTADLMGLSLRIAGFEIRDSIHWIYGSGMPKGVNISKAIDKRREDRPEVLEVARWLSARRVEAGWSIAAIDALFGFNGMASHWCATVGKAACVPTLEQWAVIRNALGFDDAEVRPLVEKLNGRKGEIGEAWSQREVVGEAYRVRRESTVQITPLSDGAFDLTAAATDQAKRWEGWNTQLRPAHEPIVVARKPTGFNTTVANVLQHGTGAINVDACRTATVSAGPGTTPASSVGGQRNAMAGALNRVEYDGAQGRWPTNVLFAHSPDCALVGERVVVGDKRSGQEPGTRPGHFLDIGSDSGDTRPNGRLHGNETVAVFECAPGCPVAELDAQSGVLTSGANPSRRSSAKFGAAYGEFEAARECTPVRGADSGSASRFFPVFRYQAKAPASERPRLADGTQHTTVKPIELMRWLVRLVTPPNGVILDPFAGSGTTLQAAIEEGFRAIGIEREEPYADLCVARLSKPLQPSLFGLDE